MVRTLYFQKGGQHSIQGQGIKILVMWHSEKKKKSIHIYKNYGGYLTQMVNIFIDSLKLMF